MKTYLIHSLRLAAVTMVVCVAGYVTLVWAFAKLFAPETAQGSLVKVDGQVIGSRLIAQKFTQPRYFWPRPSAVDYNASGAGGSNKSPANPDLTERARQTVALLGATESNPLPADLAAASGGGLDPHLSEAAALYQVPRVAQARNLDPSRVEQLVRTRAIQPGGIFTPERIVNVLELNLALDQEK